MTKITVKDLDTLWTLMNDALSAKEPLILYITKHDELVDEQGLYELGTVGF